MDCTSLDNDLVFLGVAGIALATVGITVYFTVFHIQLVIVGIAVLAGTTVGITAGAVIVLLDMGVFNLGFIILGLAVTFGLAARNIALMRIFAVYCGLNLHGLHRCHLLINAAVNHIHQALRSTVPISMALAGLAVVQGKDARTGLVDAVTKVGYQFHGITLIESAYPCKEYIFCIYKGITVNNFRIRTGIGAVPAQLANVKVRGLVGGYCVEYIAASGRHIARHCPLDGQTRIGCVGVVQLASILGPNIIQSIIGLHQCHGIIGSCRLFLVIGHGYTKAGFIQSLYIGEVVHGRAFIHQHCTLVIGDLAKADGINVGLSYAILESSAITVGLNALGLLAGNGDIVLGFAISTAWLVLNAFINFGTSKEACICRFQDIIIAYIRRSRKAAARNSNAAASLCPAFIHFCINCDTVPLGNIHAVQSLSVQRIFNSIIYCSYITSQSAGEVCHIIDSIAYLLADRGPLYSKVSCKICGSTQQLHAIIVLDGIDRSSIKNKRQLRCVHAIVCYIIEIIACIRHSSASAPVHIAKGNGIYGHGLGIIFQGCAAVFRLNTAGFISCQCHAILGIVSNPLTAFVSLGPVNLAKSICPQVVKEGFIFRQRSKVSRIHRYIGARPVGRKGHTFCASPTI